MKTKAVWGIDVGHSSLKAVRLEKCQESDVLGSARGSVITNSYISEYLSSYPGADPHKLKHASPSGGQPTGLRR